MDAAQSLCDSCEAKRRVTNRCKIACGRVISSLSAPMSTTSLFRRVNDTIIQELCQIHARGRKRPFPAFPAPKSPMPAPPAAAPVASDACRWNRLADPGTRTEAQGSQKGTLGPGDELTSPPNGTRSARAGLQQNRERSASPTACVQGLPKGPRLRTSWPTS
jgi:hypothetical protein